MDGTYTILFLPHNNIPENRWKYVTYGKVVVDYHPQKDELYCTLLIFGGNIIKYPGEVNT